MGLGLIPVGRRVEIIGTIVGVAMLDRDFDGLFKGDRTLGVPAIEAVTASRALRVYNVRRSLAPIGKGLKTEIPCAVIVVLGTGSIDGRSAVAVDEDHVVALAEPSIGVLLDAVGHSDKMAFSGGFEEDVVAFAIQIFVA